MPPLHLQNRNCHRKCTNLVTLAKIAQLNVILSRIPTAVVADRRHDPGGGGGGGWGPSSRPPQEATAEPLVQAFNRVTHKFQEFRLLPGLPSIKEISRMSDNYNKKLRKRIKGIPQGLNDMGHKITQASLNVHGNIRRRYQGIRKTLLHPIGPGEITSSLQPQIEREVTQLH